MPTLPLHIELSPGTFFTGFLERMDKGSATPSTFYIYETRGTAVYFAGQLVRYHTWEIQNREPVITGHFWKASGVLKAHSEALGLMVDAVEWGLYE